MGYEKAHAPIYGYMKGFRHTIPLHLVHYARTYSIFKLLNKIELGRVLNIGGADGYHSYLIRQIFDADVVTADINRNALAIAHEKYGLDVQYGSALDLPFEDDAFDTVLCIETIEHIEDSETVVSELRRVAKKNVIISTESFFDSDQQKADFLDYIRETHPQLYRVQNPAIRSDVSYFTKEDFHRLFESDDLDFYPQFSHKQKEIPGSINTIRAHVKAMTEDLPVNKRTKVIVHHSNGPVELKVEPLPEQTLLEAIVSDSPLFPMDLDEDMLAEDRENASLIERYHRESALCAVVGPNEATELPIEEDGAKGMTLQWLTKDDNERSPAFCTRKVRLAPGGITPPRNTAWEHQLYVLTGSGVLIEESRESALTAGTTVLVRQNLPFRIQNTGTDDMEYLDMIPSITHFFGR